jgi:hypothetical protein
MVKIGLYVPTYSMLYSKLYLEKLYFFFVLLVKHLEISNVAYFMKKITARHKKIFYFPAYRNSNTCGLLMD